MLMYRTPSDVKANLIAHYAQSPCGEEHPDHIKHDTSICPAILCPSCAPAETAMIAGTAWRACLAVLVLLVTCLIPAAAQVAYCNVTSFNISNQGIQYSANFSQISPCTVAQIRSGEVNAALELMYTDCVR